MNRTVVVDVRSTCVLGFHVGWEDPSSDTSMLAILCAASDKCEIAARYGISLAPDEWPGMLFREFLADNGEMKSEALKEAERQFRFAVEFAKAYSGQSKSLVESHHHACHKTLDHKLPGTTRGRQRKRGEPDPKLEALYRELTEKCFQHELCCGTSHQRHGVMPKGDQDEYQTVNRVLSHYDRDVSSSQFLCLPGRLLQTVPA